MVIYIKFKSFTIETLVTAYVLCSNNKLLYTIEPWYLEPLYAEFFDIQKKINILCTFINIIYFPAVTSKYFP